MLKYHILYSSFISKSGRRLYANIEAVDGYAKFHGWRPPNFVMLYNQDSRRGAILEILKKKITWPIFVTFTTQKNWGSTIKIYLILADRT
jgi:hypothetical protein